MFWTIMPQTSFLNLYSRVHLPITSYSFPKKGLNSLANCLCFLLEFPSPCPFSIQLKPIHPLNCSSDITSSVWPFPDLADRTDHFLFHTPLALGHCVAVSGCPSSTQPWGMPQRGEASMVLFISIFPALGIMYLVPGKCLLIKVK